LEKIRTENGVKKKYLWPFAFDIYSMVYCLPISCE